jgi:hypothetical protein
VKNTNRDRVAAANVGILPLEGAASGEGAD